LSEPPLLYLITDRQVTGGRSLIDVVGQALAGAGELSSRVAIQLREKDLPARALVELARGLRTITARAGARLLINDRLDVALAVGADGVHLGGGALSIAEVRALAPSFVIGVSTHRLPEIEAAKKEGAHFVVFGPVFETPSKRGLLVPTGLDQLARACEIDIPVLALGGVNQHNSVDCLHAGATGLAVIRAVCADADPLSSTRKILSCFDVLQTPV
jgi:thiamine-phosphate pyrophosphorylase